MESTRQEFADTFPDAQEVGIAFPVFLVEGIEFSFPRASSLSEELKARDLTVNAQLLDENGELICHPLGMDDLHNKVLRPASDDSFRQDPLRVFRAARFWSQLPEFTPHEDLIAAMKEAAKMGLLASIAPDRIGHEVLKALAGAAPGNFLRLLARADCLNPWFEEFSLAATIPAGPPQYHDSHVLEHTCRVMDSTAGDPIAAWMSLCHDLGKTLTPETKWPRHYGHDQSGEPLAEKLALRLRLSNRHKNAGMKAARWHMLAARYDELRPATRVDLLMDVHLSGVMAPMFALVRADHNVDFLERARRELNAILPIRLAPKDMNQGPKSGEILRNLRAQALAAMCK